MATVASTECYSMWKLVSKSVVFGLILQTTVETTLDGWLWHRASDLEVTVLTPELIITPFSYEDNALHTAPKQKVPAVNG